MAVYIPKVYLLITTDGVLIFLPFRDGHKDVAGVVIDFEKLRAFKGAVNGNLCSQSCS